MRTPRPPRTAFTLMELLAVIAIIGILASLTTVAVFYALGAAKGAQVASEIGQLATACETFKQKFGIYPPSKVVLSEDGTGMDANSLFYLKKMWPRLAFPVDWNNDGTPGNSIATLEGDQCLVFFLGGIQSPPGSTVKGTFGFSTSVVNPADMSDMANRVGPFYNFDASRLVQLHTAPNTYLSYFDPYWDGNKGRPFAYFSSGRRRNAYTPSDCPTIGAAPYIQPTGVLFHNPDSFQIICAGDGSKGMDANKIPVFGSFGLTTPPVYDPAAPAASINPPGFDDRTNFATGILGAGS